MSEESEEFEEKIIDLLQTINKKLDTLLESGKTTTSTSKVEVTSAPTKKPSEVAEKEEEKEKEKEEKKLKSEGRRKCPNCGGTDFKEVSDKTKVLHQQGGLKIYAKKYICKNCGEEYSS
jgi:rubredoxin